jgi:hypothetical protein
MIEKANQFATQFGLPATCDASFIYRWRDRNNILWQSKEQGEVASVNQEIKKP